MKKLMIIAAVVCATTFVRAASVDWQATATSAYNGQTMYLLTSIASTYESEAALAAAAVGSGVVAKVGPNYKVSKSTASNDAITKTSNFYLAVVDASDATKIHYLDVTSSMQPYVYAPPDSSPGNFSTTFATVANSTTTATIGGSTPVLPEPTSGLLMLVGLGALALRRRRA